MAQLSLLGYPKILVGHYDRKDAVKASSVEEAKELAKKKLEHPIIEGYDGDTLVFYDGYDTDILFYVIVE